MSSIVRQRMDEVGRGERTVWGVGEEKKETTTPARRCGENASQRLSMHSTFAGVTNSFSEKTQLNHYCGWRRNVFSFGF